MEIARLVLALLLPWALGLVWLRYCTAQFESRHWAMELGYAYIVGMLALTLIMRLLDAFGLTLNFALITGILLLLTAVGAWLSRGVPWVRARQVAMQPPWQRLLCAVFISLIAVRFVGLGLELYWRPLTPWDAWASWVVRAKVWFTFEQLVPFVDSASWLSDTSQTLYTIHAWRYPATVPLIQLWPALSYGQWVDGISNLPWLLCAVALALGFYGQVRLLGMRALSSVIVTYLLLSLPLLDTHTALAGYADLWMATVFGFAALSLFHWLRQKQAGQGFIALLLVGLCPLIKIEGAVWILTLLPAVIIMKIPPKWLVGFISLAAIAVVIWIWRDGFMLTLPILGEVILQPNLIQLPLIGAFKLAWRGEWQPFIDNLFILGSWHLLWYLIVIVVLASLPVIVKDKLLSAGMLVILVGLAMLFVLFFLTEAQIWADDYTSINRLFLHLTPLLLFYVALLVSAVDKKALEAKPNAVIQAA